MSNLKWGLLLALAACAWSATADLDAAKFAVPPQGNRPETWFHIIGGNVTREGLTADLEAIKAAGISGIQFFHGQFGGPWPNVPHQIQCLSPEWDSLVAYTADECKRLGLTFKMQNCPGWSMSGGPWIKPEKAMRQIVIARADVDVADGTLKTVVKPAWDPKNKDRDYQDICVLAFPTPTGDTGTELKPAKHEKHGLTQTFIYNEPVTVRTVQVPDPGALSHAFCNNIDTRIKIEAQRADGSFAVVRVCDYPQGNWHEIVPLTLAVDETTAKVWRVSFTTKRAIKAPWVKLYSAARFDNWEGRAAWTLRGMGWELNAPKQVASARVRVEDILDLTANRAADGTVTAKVPHGGKWTVIRFGHVNMCKRNGPAPAAGTGWECDKLDPKGAEAQYAGYIGRLAHGPLAGGKLQGMLLDSWECGRQTWTGRMEEYFQARNGYAIRKYLPALFGWVLDTPAETDKFLLDWRNLTGALVEENFFHRMVDLAHKDNLAVQYETAYGDVIPGDLLKFWKYADTPMCEFWQPHTNDGYVGDHDFKPVVPCVSAAHIYGKKRVAAEAFTSFSLTWDENFRLLKNVGNKHFARGVTHCVFHTYTHNPQVGWKKPGSSFGSAIGTPFLRGQTWWPYMRNWTDYLARINVMLEEGRPCADILWYLGDYVGHKPSEHEEPFGNRFKADYLNPDGLFTRVSIKDGRWTLPDGTSYARLWLPPNTFLTAASRARLAELEKQGGRIARGADPTQGLVPDVSDGRVLWNHRTDGRREWYFVTAKGGGFKGAVTFRAKGAAEIWDPVTGKVAAAKRAGEAVVLDLASDEAVFVVFDPQGKAAAPAPVVPTAEAKLGRWTLALGAGAAHELDEFVAWKDLPNLTKEEHAFSGTGTYRAEVTVAKTGACTLDLGRVESWATVWVNDRKVASLWCKPYRCEIGEFLKEGKNALRVEVTGTWFNRLVYDAKQPEAKRQTWVISGPGAGSALRPSGLLGPVFISADPASVKEATAVFPQDRTTQGDWPGTYGRLGYFIVGPTPESIDYVHLPAAVESIRFQQPDGKEARRSNAARAIDAGARYPTAPTAGAVKTFAHRFSELHGSMDVFVNLRAGNPMRVTLYTADCDGGGRSAEIVAYDAATGRRLAQRAYVTDFAGGAYLTYTYDRPIRIRITCTGGDNAVASAVFFDPVK